MKQFGQRLKAMFTIARLPCSVFDGGCPLLILPGHMFLSKPLTAGVVIPEFMSLTAST